MSLGEPHHNRFPSVLLQPLGHLSVFKINDFERPASDYRTRRRPFPHQLDHV